MVGWLLRHGLLDRLDLLVFPLVVGNGKREPHPGNFLQVGSWWMLVDWDTVLIAPPERDLWLLDPGDGSIADAYRQATGRVVIPAMLDLYRLTWELSDLASCAARFRQGHADTPEDRKEWEILSGSRLCSSS